MAHEIRAMIETRFPTVRVLVGRDATAHGVLPQVDVLLAFDVPSELSNARKLRWFQCTAAGVDHLRTLRENAGDVVVTNTRGIHGEIIADYVIGGITMLHWNFPRLLKCQELRQWKPQRVKPLSAMTVGIVGLGSIGTSIARRAKSAGMTVIGSKRDVSYPVACVDQLFGASDLDAMLPQCDFVVMAVPATQETSGLMDRARFTNMRQSAYLLNIGRGNVLVEEHLIEALELGNIAGAMLDVFEAEPLPCESPLWTMPNVIATPHISAASTSDGQFIFEVFADNLQRFLEGKALRNVIDLRRGY
ncbi:D-2-hydroxyacid dehydrogenase [Bradyrhizobium sp. 4]|nr:D-2-hydroxyacid dehydrogenase [Bradyrhizobium sp. 39]MCK1524993.1 D-2-hydroxyacid dehydrogenase [Bradyrhizobium sp. 17]MCK1632592.1 D-2-hydroxyacid dehydrogenase [Bradyrhizobium sp. 162]MCK1750166.1 D-2-hydroxyacid dehydrogenase [Bradyrhizobium sp. 135]UPJ38655.1 D-2-hydroxyacid dehydrogenase [Bradyrhizobium sp. 4]